jgi:ABC-type polysaccharide/polyol phosphate export permease
LLLTVGAGLVVASLNVFVRDLGQALGTLLMAWFYLTPIVYPLHLVPEPWRHWLLLNPMTPLVDLYRQAFLGSALRVPDGLWILAVAAAIAMMAGHLICRRLEPHLADQL